MGDASMDGLSDAGSTPARSTFVSPVEHRRRSLAKFSSAPLGSKSLEILCVQYFQALFLRLAEYFYAFFMSRRIFLRLFYILSNIFYAFFKFLPIRFSHFLHRNTTVCFARARRIRGQYPHIPGSREEVRRGYFSRSQNNPCESRESFDCRR